MDDNKIAVLAKQADKKMGPLFALLVQYTLEIDQLRQRVSALEAAVGLDDG